MRWRHGNTDFSVPVSNHALARYCLGGKRRAPYGHQYQRYQRSRDHDIYDGIVLMHKRQVMRGTIRSLWGVTLPVFLSD